MACLTVAASATVPAMRNLRRALRQRRRFQAQVHAHRQQADAALATLRAQYQRHIPLSLTAAAATGMALGRHGGGLRPPTLLLRAAFGWGSMLVRGLL